MILPDLHLHTPLCGHATGSPDAYARRAVELGLRRIVFTDHGPLDDRTDAEHRMKAAQLPGYIRDIRQLARQWAPRLKIGLGLEMDWIPAHEQLNRRIADCEDWDLLLGSVHFIPDHGALRFIIRCEPAGEREILRSYWRTWGDAAASGIFHAMSHPDIYRACDRDPLPGERKAACRALDRAARSGVALECNTSLLRKGLHDFYPAPWLLEEILQRGLCLTSASDAHQPDQVGLDQARLASLAAADARVRFVDFRQGKARNPQPNPALSAGSDPA